MQGRMICQQRCHGAACAGTENRALSGSSTRVSIIHSNHVLVFNSTNKSHPHDKTINRSEKAQLDQNACHTYTSLTYLEPRHVLLVESPRLPLQLSCRQVLLVGPLLVVEDEEQSVRVEFLEHLGVLQCSRRLGWVGCWRPVWVPWYVPITSFTHIQCHHTQQGDEMRKRKRRQQEKKRGSNP